MIERFEVTERYAQAVVCGGLVFVAGQIAQDWSGDAASQSREVLDRVERILLQAGSAKPLLLSMTVYLADFADYAAFNAVYDEWVVPTAKPARATVRAELLDPALRIEVQATAARSPAAGASERMVRSARSRVAAMSARDVMANHDPDLLFVDVRERHEVEEGTIPGAVHAPRGLLEWHLDPMSDLFKPELATAARLVMVCGSGARAAMAADLASSAGLDACYLEGGMRAWHAAGGPVATA